MIRERYVIGVDDSDAPGQPGTGELLRAMGERAAADGFAEPQGVTRHALWESPKVRATDENACYALVIEAERDALDVEDFAAAFVREQAAPGANAGLALLTRHSDMPHALAFGRRAKQELLRVQDAETYAAEANVLVRSLGASRDGMVGALAAAGLRGGGRDGRYLWFAGSALLLGRVTAAWVRESTALQRLLDPDGEEIDRDDVVDFGEGFAPAVEDGRPVLRVVRAAGDRRIWVPAAQG